MRCTMLTDNHGFKTDYWYDNGTVQKHQSIECALVEYLSVIVQKTDNAIGVNYAAVVAEKTSNLHTHIVLWSAKSPTFDYIKRVFPGYRYDDCKTRLTASIDYLYKRNGHEEKGHSNMSEVIQYGELPLVDVGSQPSEWVEFVKAGHSYKQLIEMYPSALGRAYGLKQYINERGISNESGS